MKRIITLLLLSVLPLTAAQRVSLQVTNDTLRLPPNSPFFSANSNELVSVVAGTLISKNVLTVSPDGNDATAIVGNPLKPFATIQAAFSNAPNNSLIRILPGTWASTPTYNRPDSFTSGNLLSVPFLLWNKTNIHIAAEGVVITGAGTGAYVGLANCKNITISGMAFELTKGVGTEVTNSYIGTITMYGTNANLTFDRIRIVGATDQGLTGSRFEYGVKVSNSHFENIGSTNVSYVTNLVGYPYVDGTAISGLGSDTLIENCSFNLNYRDIEWDGITSNPAHSGLHIANCTFSNYLHGSIVTYDATTNVAKLQNVSIVGCTFQPLQSENAVNSRDGVLQTTGAIWMECGSNVKIIGNSFENLFDRGVYLNCSSPMENIVISGNTFRGSSTGITNASNSGIVLVNNGSLNATNPYPLKNITISGNRLSNLGATAIHAMGANITIIGNGVWDACRSSGGLYGYTIGGSSGVSNVLVSANTYSDSRSGSYAHGFAVNAGSKKVNFSRDNVARNVDTSLLTSPLTVNSGAYSEVFADGKTLTATLVAGTVTVNYPLVHANSRIQVSRNVTGGTTGHLSVTRVNETSFTVTSTSNTDTSTLAITIFEDHF